MIRKVLLAAVLPAFILIAGSVNANDFRKRKIEVFAVLKSVNEAPTTLSTTGKGTLKLTIDTEAQTIDFELSYSNLEGSAAPTQAHIHVGQRHSTGAVVLFFCSNGAAPAGTQTCPEGPATITGTLKAADILGGAAAAGLPAGAFDELVGLIRDGDAYANVHTTGFPAGEIRGQTHELSLFGH